MNGQDTYLDINGHIHLGFYGTGIYSYGSPLVWAIGFNVSANLNTGWQYLGGLNVPGPIQNISGSITGSADCTTGVTINSSGTNPPTHHQ